MPHKRQKPSRVRVMPRLTHNHSQTTLTPNRSKLGTNMQFSITTHLSFHFGDDFSQDFSFFCVFLFLTENKFMMSHLRVDVVVGFSGVPLRFLPTDGTVKFIGLAGNLLVFVCREDSRLLSHQRNSVMYVTSSCE